jgi:hypothetical protein
MKFVLLAILAGILCACGLVRAEENKKRYALMRTEIKSCEDQLNNGVLKTFVQVEICISAVRTRAFEDVKYRHMDILYTLNGSRLRVAERIDLREISETQGKALFAELTATALREQNRRKASEDAIAASDSERYLPLLQTGLGLLQPAPRPLPVTCHTWRNTTTCY